MARIRTVKPDFFTSEDIITLSAPGRLLYIALWCEADREGRLSWKPRTFKLRYFPADDFDIPALCDEIVAAGLVVLYGDGLAYIPSFAKHQNINPRESASTLPAPDAGPQKRRVSDASVTHSEEGKERKAIARQVTRGASERFERFWQAYPKKVSKGQAEKAFAKLVTDDTLLDIILAALARARERPDWQKDGGQFVPYPATWLGARGWEDDLGPPDDTRTRGLFAGVE